MFSLHRLFPAIFPLLPQRVGRIAEGKAAEFLKRKGFRILARNWRPKHGKGELDIVASFQEQLIFVEVRARAANAPIRGALTLGEHKRKVLRKTIEAYLRQRRYKIDDAPAWRVDVVEAQTLGYKVLELNHFEGVTL